MISWSTVEGCLIVLKYTQEYDIDYKVIFAIVSMMTIFRALMLQSMVGLLLDGYEVCFLHDDLC